MVQPHLWVQFSFLKSPKNNPPLPRGVRAFLRQRASSSPSSKKRSSNSSSPSCEPEEWPLSGLLASRVIEGHFRVIYGHFRSISLASWYADLRISSWLIDQIVRPWRSEGPVPHVTGNLSDSDVWRSQLLTANHCWNLWLICPFNFLLKWF